MTGCSLTLVLREPPSRTPPAWDAALRPAQLRAQRERARRGRAAPSPRRLLALVRLG